MTSIAYKFNFSGVSKGETGQSLLGLEIYFQLSFRQV